MQPRIITTAVCALLAVSIVDASSDKQPSTGVQLANEAEGRVRDFEKYINSDNPNPWLLHKTNMECDEKETYISDKLLMRNAIFIYRTVIRTIIDAYKKYQTEKNKTVDGVKVRQEAVDNFVNKIKLYMGPLIQFSNNFDITETIEAQAGKVVDHESSKGKWNKIKMIIKGSVKIASITLAVMALNIPELTGTIQAISKTVHETVTAFKDAGNGVVADTPVGAYMDKTYKFGEKKAREIAMAVQAKDKKNTSTITSDIIIKVFETMLEQNKFLVTHYYEVVEFEGLTEEQRKAAKELADKIFWIQAPIVFENHNAQQITKLKDALKLTFSYIKDLHAALMTQKLFKGSVSKKLYIRKEECNERVVAATDGFTKDTCKTQRRLSTNPVMDRLLQQTASQ